MRVKKKKKKKQTIDKNIWFVYLKAFLAIDLSTEFKTVDLSLSLSLPIRKIKGQIRRISLGQNEMVHCIQLALCFNQSSHNLGRSKQYYLQQIN